jgi:CHAT domain-containing protein
MKKIIVLFLLTFNVSGVNAITTDEIVDFIGDDSSTVEFKIKKVDEFINSGLTHDQLDFMLYHIFYMDYELFDLVKHLIKKGANVHRVETDLPRSAQAEDGRTIGQLGLKYYSKKGLIEETEYLKRLGATYHITYLYESVKKDNTIEALKVLKQGLNPTDINDFKKTGNNKSLLHYAVKKGNLALVQAIVNAGADVNVVDNSGASALSRLQKDLKRKGAGAGDYNAVMTYLLSKGAITPFSGRNALSVYQKVLLDMHHLLEKRDFQSFIEKYFLPVTVKDMLDMANVSTVNDLLNSDYFDSNIIFHFIELKIKIHNIINSYKFWSVGLSSTEFDFNVVNDFEYKKSVLKGVTTINLDELEVEGLNFDFRENRKVELIKDKSGDIKVYLTLWELKSYDVSHLNSVVEQFAHILNVSELPLKAEYFDVSLRAFGLLEKMLNNNLDPSYGLLVYPYKSKVQFESGDFKGAEESLLQALAIDNKVGYEKKPLPGLLISINIRSQLLAIYITSLNLEKIIPVIESLEKPLSEMMVRIDKKRRYKSADNARRKLVSDVAKVYQNIAASYYFIGVNDESKNTVDKILNLLNNDVDEYTKSLLYLSRISLLTKSGHYGEAEAGLNQLNKRLVASGLTHTDMFSQVLTGYALINAVSHQDYGSALNYAKKATGLIRDLLGSEHEQYAASLNILGQYELLLSHYKKALSYFMQAENIFSRNNSKNIWASWALIAKTNLNLGKIVEAEKYNKLTKESVLAAFGKNSMSYADVLSIEADILEKKGKKHQSIQRWKQVVNIIEQSRNQFSEEADRREFLTVIKKYYNSLTRLALEQNDLALAMNTIERLKSKTLLELLASKPITVADVATNKLLAKINQVDTKRRLLLKEDKSAVIYKSSNSRGLKRIKSKTPVINKERQQLVQRIREINPGVTQLVSVEATSLHDIQQMLDSDTVLLMYHSMDDLAKEKELVALTITADQVNWTPLQNPEQIYAKIDKFYAQLKKPTSDNRQVIANAKSLYSQLIKPLNTKIAGFKNLVIIPSGKLNFLSFPALHDGKQFLVEQFRLVNVPSASIYKLLENRDALPISSLLAFGDPLSKLGRLSGAQAEVRKIAALFPDPQIYIGDAASESKLRAIAQPPSVLHIASHGVFDPQSPDKSFLALTRDAANDGNLETYEAYGLNLDGTRLVVLSACETGVGKVLGGDEVVSLIQPFLYSGSQNVVASLWQVDDDSTMALMTGFYHELLKNKRSEAAAMQAAQQALLKSPRFAHPYYWSAFQIYGVGVR